jgi:hypothetical protein
METMTENLREFILCNTQDCPEKYKDIFLAAKQELADALHSEGIWEGAVFKPFMPVDEQEALASDIAENWSLVIEDWQREEKNPPRKVRCSSRFGEAVESGSVAELYADLAACGTATMIPSDGLKEGRDYEYVEEA